MTSQLLKKDESTISASRQRYGTKDLAREIDRVIDQRYQRENSTGEAKAPKAANPILLVKRLISKAKPAH